MPDMISVLMRRSIVHANDNLSFHEGPEETKNPENPPIHPNFL
jgi:hypothetical protein